MESIIDGIMEAQERLLKEHIRANCVVVDKKYIQLKRRLAVGVCQGVIVVPPMIGGLRAVFADLPEDTAFFVLESNNLPATEYERMKNENDDLKDQLRRIREALGMEPGEELPRKGRWYVKIDQDDYPLFRRKFVCSACGSWTTYGMTDYCPNCGAKMEVQDEVEAPGGAE